MDTVLDDLAQRAFARGLLGGVRVGLDAGNLGCHAACRCQQEVSRAARRVEHLEIEDSLAGVVWVSCDCLGKNGLKRRLDQFAHQGRWCVVGPGQLSI